MPVKKEKKNNYTVIKTDYLKLNYENAKDFSKLVVDYIEEENPKNLAIDFKGLTYISSIGIAALSIIKGTSKISKCNLALINLSAEVSETLKMTGVDTMFKIVNTEEEAAEYFKISP